jgi:uncharacterized protein YcbK (DUF882 family)
MMKKVLVTLIISVLCTTNIWGAPYQFNEGKAGFLVTYKDIEVPYKVFALFALPGETIPIGVSQIPAGEKASLTATKGEIQKYSEIKWTWKAPQNPGRHQLKCSITPGHKTIRINAFVMVPYEELEGGRLYGTKMGSYPAKNRKSTSFETPPGFVVLTHSNRNTQLSPHFRLHQFVQANSKNEYQFLALDEKLLLKLELIVNEVNKHDHPTPTLRILSGFRSPKKNRKIRAEKYSYHLMGKAVDFIVDSDPVDNIMDDLSQDGHVNPADGKVVYGWINELFKDPRYQDLQGGLGFYKKSKTHGPFLHTDVRGHPTRWKK